MAWFDVMDIEFAQFLMRLFDSGDEMTSGDVALKQQQANDAVISGDAKLKENPILTDINKITAEQAKAGGVTPSPTASPVPSAKPSAPPTAPPTPSPAGTPGPTPQPGSKQSEVMSALPEFLKLQQQATGNQDPYAVTNTSPVWVARRKAGQVIKDPDSPGRQRQVTQPGDITRPVSEVLMDPYRWDGTKAKDMAELMENAGFNTAGGNIDQMAQIWKSLTTTAARFWMVGKKVSPMDILKRTADGMQAAAPKTTTSTSTTVSLTNAVTAKQLAHAALSQRLGRQATDDEVAEFTKALLAAEKKNPTTTTTTTTTDPKGNSTSQSTSKQGLNAGDYAVDWSMGHNKEEAAAFQSAGIMMPWLFEALEAPV